MHFKNMSGNDTVIFFRPCTGLRRSPFGILMSLVQSRIQNSLYAAAIPRFIDALLEGRSPVVFGDGEQSRDFVFIDDVVQANLLAMSAHHLFGDVVNVARGRSLSINELLAILKDVLGSKVLPDYEEPRTGEVRHSLGDIQRGKQLLNYAPRVEMREGLEKTVGYFMTKRKEMLKR